MCGFIAQLLEHRTGIVEVMGSNLVEALIFFSLLLSNCLNWKIYCDDHTSLSPQENINSFAVLPFINGVTQPLTRILRRHDIQVLNKPLKTLQQEFLLLNSGHLSNVNPMWFIKYPVPIVFGVMRPKLTSVLKLTRKNTSGMS